MVKQSRRWVGLIILPVILAVSSFKPLLAQTGPSAPLVTDPADSQMIPGMVYGKVKAEDGGSMAGGRVMFYAAEYGPPPKAGEYTKVPSSTSEILLDGSFSAEILPGDYYLFALKRNSGENFGRPIKGDYILKLHDGKGLKIIAVIEAKQIDLGTLEAHIKRDWPSRSPAQKTENGTAITGTILDMEGNPIENALVFAFSAPQMQGRPPQFISKPSGKDGRYFLGVAGGHTYYLKARNAAGGGQIKTGDFMGIYGKEGPVGIPIKTGEVVKEIDIDMYNLDLHFPRKLLIPDAP